MLSIGSSLQYHRGISEGLLTAQDLNPDEPTSHRSSWRAKLMSFKWAHSKTAHLLLFAFLLLVQMAPSIARANTENDRTQNAYLRINQGPNYGLHRKPQDGDSPSRNVLSTQSLNVKQDQRSSGGGEGHPEDWGSPRLWRDFGWSGNWRPVLISLFGFIFSWRV
jgi:hypothetical protein